MIREKIKKIFNIPEAIIEVPENKNFGDYSTGVALKLAKKEGKNPLAVAQDLAQKIKNDGISREIFAEIEVAPPGFINFRLTNDYLQKEVAEILRQKEKYGQLDFGGGKKIQVEFISANPTGPLTLGNGRGGFYGDVLANVLACAGYEVKREYYINNLGEQIAALGHSYLEDEKAVYKGDYLKEMKRKYGKKIQKSIDKERQYIIDNIKINTDFFLHDFDEHIAIKFGFKVADIILVEHIKKTIEDKMKIRFDVWFRESDLVEEMNKIIDELEEKKLTYKKEDGSIWFKSTKFGDDKDRVIVRSKETLDSEDEITRKTYLLSDIAYLKNKFGRGFKRLIYVWGADHHGYIGRLKAAAESLGFNSDDVEIIIMQLVRLVSGGQEIKMSKRAGTYITLDELLDEIPLHVVRFFFLMRAPDTHMNFDLDLAREQSEKNPVYYTQYAYARICSILRKAQNSHLVVKSSNHSISQSLNHSSELDLIKQLIRLPEIIEDTARDFQVQRLPQYTLDLVRAFHKFYEECRVISEDKEKSGARLGLVEATRIVLKNTLDLMGISAPERM